jgi:hypothetical protein
MMYHWIQGTLVLCCSIALYELPTFAQLPPSPTNNSTLIAPTPSVITLKSGEILRVKVVGKPTGGNRLPAQTETAVFLGDLDITSQMQREGQELVYKSTLLPLPIGEQTLTVYRTTTPDRWESIATFSVKLERFDPSTVSDFSELKHRSNPIWQYENPLYLNFLQCQITSQF